MELTILDKLINGPLKPWKFDFQNTKRIVEIIKAARAINPDNYQNLLAYLAALLQDHSTLQKELLTASDKKSTITTLYYQPELPDYVDIPTQYYKLLIDSEVVRVFNSLILQHPGWEQPVDVVYNIMATLNNTKVLTLQAISELNEIDAEASLTDLEKLTQFVLHYLVASLTALYFSVQEEFKAELPQIITQEDYHMLDLQQPRSALTIMEMVMPEEHARNVPEYTEMQEQISFGFTGEVAKLKLVINQLCFRIQLLNEDVTEADDLIKLLISKKILPNAIKIQIGCETKHFRYTVDKLKPYFTDLTLSNIEKSKVFYSKNDTLITANNLSASNSKNKIEPKEKANIDKIMKQMQ